MSYLAMLWKEEVSSLMHSKWYVWDRGEHPCPDSNPGKSLGWQSSSGSLQEAIQAREEQGRGEVGYITPFL